MPFPVRANNVVIGSDDSVAIIITEFQQIRQLPNAFEIGAYLKVQLTPDGEQSRIVVAFDDLMSAESLKSFSLPFNSEDPDLVRLDLAEAALGEHLVKHGVPDLTPSGTKPYRINCGYTQLAEWRDRKPAQRDVITAYVEAKARAAWHFDQPYTTVHVPDLIRLKINVGRLNNVIDLDVGTLFELGTRNVHTTQLKLTADALRKEPRVVLAGPVPEARRSTDSKDYTFENSTAAWPKKYTNALARTIVDTGLPIELFATNATEDNNWPAFVIALKDTPLAFTVRCKNDVQFDVFFNRFSPGMPIEGPIPTRGSFNFDGVLQYLNRWLTGDVQELIDEQNVPDLWNQAQSSFAGLAVAGDDRTSTFTDLERDGIDAALNRFEHEIIVEFDPTPEQLLLITEELRYLRAATERLSKFDWRALAISTVMGIATALSLDTERGKALYSLFRAALASALHLLK